MASPSLVQPPIGPSPSSTPPGSSYAARIHQVQVDALRRSFPFALAGSLITACFSVFALLDVLPRHEILLWITATLAVGALRLAAMVAYDRRRDDPSAARRWLRRMLIGNLSSGILWGLPLAYWTFFLPLEYQLFFIVILFGLGTGAIYSNYILMPVMYAFEIPAFAPMFIALAVQPSAIHLALVTSGLAYLVATLAFIHRMNRTHLDALRLGYENLALLDQVRQEKTAAERSDLEKSRFLAAASHDLRQPVHAVNLFLGLLTNEPLSPHGRYLVDNIASAISAMGHLFDALLNLSRLDAGVIEPRIERFRVRLLLDQLRAEYAPQASEKGIRLRVRTCSASVRSDPVLLERILRNLISNAIMHTAHGRVLIGCRRVADALRIEVWDNGPGIPKSEQERVFWEFHQLGNPERDRGKGLGRSCGGSEWRSGRSGSCRRAARAPGRRRWCCRSCRLPSGPYRALRRSEGRRRPGRGRPCVRACRCPVPRRRSRCATGYRRAAAARCGRRSPPHPGDPRPAPDGR